jgi:hypothetical protein
MSAKRLFTAIVCASMSCGAAELHWRNGEWITGDFLAAEKDRLAWRSPMFAEPIRVVQARFHHAQRERRLSITGLPKGSILNRLLDGNGRRMQAMKMLRRAKFMAERAYRPNTLLLDSLDLNLATALLGVDIEQAHDLVKSGVRMGHGAGSESPHLFQVLSLGST